MTGSNVLQKNLDNFKLVGCFQLISSDFRSFEINCFQKKTREIFSFTVFVTFCLIFTEHFYELLASVC